jgi:hypothetical protein
LEFSGRTVMFSVEWGLGKFGTNRDGEREVRRELHKGSIEMCCALQIIFCW